MLLCGLIVMDLDSGSKQTFYTRIPPAVIKKLNLVISDSRECSVDVDKNGQVLEMPSLSLRFEVLTEFGKDSTIKRYLRNSKWFSKWATKLFKTSKADASLDLYGLEKFGKVEEKRLKFHLKLSRAISVLAYSFLLVLVTSSLWIEQL